MTYDINEKLNTRFNLNGASFDYDDEDEGVNYKGNLKGLTIGGLLDYHPTGGGFRLTAGIYNNSNEFDLDAEGDNDEAEIGDGVYDLTGANLNSNVSFKSMAPYLGLGYGNAVKKGTGKWGFSLDAGVLFQGAPEGKLTASGTGREVTTNAEIDLANDPVFQAELAKEQEDLNKEMEDFEMFPVISIGASYRF